MGLLIVLNALSNPIVFSFAEVAKQIAKDWIQRINVNLRLTVLYRTGLMIKFFFTYFPENKHAYFKHFICVFFLKIEFVDRSYQKNQVGRNILLK